MNDSDYEAQVAEVERDRAAALKFAAKTFGEIWDRDCAQIAELFPLPEKPKKLREVLIEGMYYRYRDGVVEYRIPGETTWEKDPYPMGHYVAIASLATHPYEEEAP